MVGSMIAAGVWTGVGFLNLKNSWTGSGPRFKNFETGAELVSEKIDSGHLCSQTKKEPKGASA